MGLAQRLPNPRGPRDVRAGARAHIWDDVCREPEDRSQRPLAVALPGVDDARTAARLADQLEATVRQQKPWTTIR